MSVKITVIFTGTNYHGNVQNDPEKQYYNENYKAILFIKLILQLLCKSSYRTA